MGQSTEELTSQIDQTRNRMASDVDALQDRVSPSAIVERRKAATKERLGSVKYRIMGAKDTVTSTSSDAASGAVSTTRSQVQGSPMGAGLAAFGAGLVISSLFPATKAEAEAAHRTMEAAKEHGQPLVDDAKQAAQEIATEAKAQVTEAAQQVKESAADSAGTVKLNPTEW
jgi:hypothetical protein